MQFDNKYKVLNLNKRRYIILLFFASVIGLLIFSNLFNEPVWGIDKTTAVIIAISLYMVYITIIYILNYHYIIYSDEGDKISLKFVSLRPFDNKRNVIEIPKKRYNGYKVSRSFFNLKEELILSIHTDKGAARYPPVSITALTPKQKKMLFNSLNQL
ncbi:MAG: hypothetical protein V2I54_13180 [Bacteroidales bacterium]|jgi:hypothetical protein|nr:hypothetical protein [Bacteroidales bacterium]